MQEPLSVEGFKKNHWQYLLYSDIDKLLRLKEPKFDLFAKDIK